MLHAAKYREGQILIRPKRPKALSALDFKGHCVLRRFHEADVEVIKLPPGLKVWEAVEQYRSSGLVHFAEPDYVVEGALTPNDPFFRGNLLWGFNDVGQNGSSTDADIDAPEGWGALHSAPDTIVAVIDTGVRYTHEDLAPNMWVNSGEIPNNGMDDDGNGIVDDVHGLNAITGSGDPKDDHGHGTHVAGIIGAAGNNGKGLVGVAWKVQLMACKFLDSSNKGSVSDALECIQYARKKGAHIINASWSIPSNSSALYSAINSAKNAGILFVTAAGNEALNLDVTPRYPACYNLDNIVSVASTTQARELDAGRSNYGATTVDLAAPGVTIYSTWYSSNASYQFMTGTSMAAPFVTGVLALMRTYYPTEDYRQMITRLLAAADPAPSLAGKTVSGGCVNLRRALGVAKQAPTVIPTATTVQIARAPYQGALEVKLKGAPGQTYVLQSSTNMLQWTSLSTNLAAPDGSMAFIDYVRGSSTQRYYRGLSLP